MLRRRRHESRLGNGHVLLWPRCPRPALRVPRVPHSARRSRVERWNFLILFVQSLGWGRCGHWHRHEAKSGALRAWISCSACRGASCAHPTIRLLCFCRRERESVRTKSGGRRCVHRCTSPFSSLYAIEQYLLRDRGISARAQAFTESESGAGSARPSAIECPVRAFEWMTIDRRTAESVVLQQRGAGAAVTAGAAAWPLIQRFNESATHA